MPLDPNWFYSSLAQAAAAIVGIVGGFVLTAVLRHREQAATRRTQLAQDGRQMITSLQQLAASHREFATWFDESMAPLLHGKESGNHSLAKVVMIRGGVYGGEGWPVNPGDFALLRRMREVAGKWSVILDGSERVTAVLQTSYRERSAFVARFEDDALELSAIDEAWRPGHPQANLGQIAAGSASPLRETRARARDYFGKLGVAEREAIPATLYVAVALLGFLAAVGVIAPLTQLTAFEISHKFWLTLLFAVGLATLLAFALNEIRRVRAMSRITETDLEEAHFLDSLV